MPRLVAVLVLAAACVFSAQAALAFPTYAGGEGFRGAELMSREERQAHVARMQSMQTYAECEAYLAGHETELQQRAQAAGRSLPARGADPCAVMRFFGRIK
jgi:hypothetical protein